MAHLQHATTVPGHLLVPVEAPQKAAHHACGGPLKYTQRQRCGGCCALQWCPLTRLPPAAVAVASRTAAEGSCLLRAPHAAVGCCPLCLPETVHSFVVSLHACCVAHSAGSERSSSCLHCNPDAVPRCTCGTHWPHRPQALALRRCSWVRGMRPAQGSTVTSPLPLDCHQAISEYMYGSPMCSTGDGAHMTNMSIAPLEHPIACCALQALSAGGGCCRGHAGQGAASSTPAMAAPPSHVLQRALTLLQSH